MQLKFDQPLPPLSSKKSKLHDLINSTAVSQFIVGEHEFTAKTPSELVSVRFADTWFAAVEKFMLLKGLGFSSMTEDVRLRKLFVSYVDADQIVFSEL